MIITNHAAKRFKQRVGLPKKACLRHAELAFTNGFTHSEARGKAKRYLDKLFLEYHKADNMRVYGGFVYLFVGETLITILPLPRNMKNGFRLS